MREEVYEHLTSLKKICEYSEDLDNQDTDDEHTKRYGNKQQQKGNMGLNHKALEINISSKAISFSQSDPKGNTLL